MPQKFKISLDHHVYYAYTNGHRQFNDLQMVGYSVLPEINAHRLCPASLFWLLTWFWLFIRSLRDTTS